MGPLSFFEKIVVKEHLVIHDVGDGKLETSVLVLFNKGILQIVWDRVAGFVLHNKLIQPKMIMRLINIPRKYT